MINSGSDTPLDSIRSDLPRAAELTSEPAQIEAVAIYFDLRQSIALIRQVGPKPVSYMIRHLFSMASGIIADHNGFIADPNGDGGLALFGGPDAGRMAILTAVKLVELSISTLPEELHRHCVTASSKYTSPIEVNVSVGIDCGYLYAVRIETPEYDGAWTGICTHIVSRLAKLAPYGGIAITKRALPCKSLFDLEGRFITKEKEVEVGGILETVLMAHPTWRPAQ